MSKSKNLSFAWFLVGLASIFIFSCQSASSQQGNKEESKPDSVLLKPNAQGKVELSEEQWKKILTPKAFAVLREQETEFPYTGDLLKNKKEGVYVCAGCKLPLFSSKTKFESGTGWPSFYDVIDKKNIKEIKDHSLGMNRIEVTCSRCGGHIGHVFEDGPVPTGLRYCMNSAALNFQEKK